MTSTESSRPQIQATQREEELHWLALHLTPGLGPRRTVQLIERFRSPQAVFRATVSQLEAAGLSGSAARSIASGCSFEEAAAQQEKMLQAGVSLVTFGGELYPQRLREIYDPPLVLFAQGRVELLHSVCLGVVGTRRPTHYGVAATEHLAADLSRAGLTIVSGLARGIDTAAHRATLAAGGNTIAVLGCGIDGFYPAENRKLQTEIGEKGLVLTESAFGAPPYPQNFPMRNRVISGLSAGVLVVEGAQYSGSAITARLAMDQGREVFAVPGNITSRLSWVPNLLIKQGCKLVQEWNDVVAELPASDRRRLLDLGRQRLLELGGETSAPPAASESRDPATPLQRAILELLKVDLATHVDDVLENLEHYSSSEVIAALFELELSGSVRQLPGRNFLKSW